MKLRPHYLFSIVLVACALCIVFSVHRLRAAQAQLDSTIKRHSQVRDDLHSIERLAAEREVVSLTARPTQDVVGLINQSLINAGLPTSTLTSFAEESNQALRQPGTSNPSGPSYRKQSIRVSLAPLALPRIGAILSQLAAADTPWRCAQIELQHHGSAESRDSAYSVRLLLSAVYLDRSGT